MKITNGSKSYVVFLTLVLALPAVADDAKNQFGVRANVLVGSGKPANDILGAGLIAFRYRDDGWFYGGSIDNYAYDFERPASYVGLAQDSNVDVIDADGSNTVIAGFLGREYDADDGGFRWFWTAGIGLGFADVDDVSGPTDTGGTFDLTFKVDTEVHVMGTLGAGYDFSPKWSTTLSTRLEHHFMSIQITDQVTGNTASIDSQTVMGAYLSLNYRF